MSKELAKTEANDRLAEQIATLIENAKQHIVTTVNSTMTATYYEIGRRLVEHEQKGKKRAQYGAKLIPDLAKRLTERLRARRGLKAGIFCGKARRRFGNCAAAKLPWFFRIP